MSETWKEIPGTDGFYEVSTKGRLRSWKKVGRYGGRLSSPRILSTREDKDGYLIATIRVNCQPVGIRVSRAVLMAFVGPGENMEACHNNGDVKDNRLENLRWDTSKGNHRDKALHGTKVYGSRATQSKLTEDQVRWARTVFVRGCKRYGSKALGERFGVSQKTMHNAIVGKTWNHVK